MKLFVGIIVGLFLWPNLEAADDACIINDNNLVKEVSFKNEIPEYFFKSIMPQNENDSRNQATVILSGKGNVLLDLNTGLVEKIPGPYDAVPSIDGQIVTVPGNPENGNSLTIFDRNKLKTPIFKDDGDQALVGVYQSVGLFKVEEFSRTYRIITDVLTGSDGRGSDLYYKDYKVENNQNVLRVKNNDKSNTKKLCSNINSKLKLPMISKNGKMLAAYNVESGTTYIYRVETSSNGNSMCIIYKDLGFATTKVEFSADSKKITFAADSQQTFNENVNWKSQPEISYMNLNVYVMDLEKNKLVKISHNANGNSYYPSFSRDETVTYLNQKKVGSDTFYSLNQAKISKEDTVESKDASFYQFTKCEYSKEELALIAIGKLWFNVCKNFAGLPTALGSRFQALSLNPKQCENLVKTYWDRLKDEKIDLKYMTVRDSKESLNGNGPMVSSMASLKNFRELTEKDLLSQCPKNIKPRAQVIVKSIKLNGVENNSNLLMSRCAGCHTQGTSRLFIVGDNESELTYKQKAIMYVKSGYMPMGGNLSEKERQEVLDYLEAN